jgi:beta-glucosidase
MKLLHRKSSFTFISKHGLNVMLILLFSSISFINVQAQQTLSARIDSIIGLMTNAEKISQMTNATFFTTGTNTRLNIPGLVMSDGPHGVRYGGNTAFPVGVAMAATFDMDMLYKVGKAMGEEFWVNGINQQLGPCIDLCRDPRAGRSAESGSEDPFLSGHVGAALIKGIQSNSPVIATIKHFMVESKQSNRNTCNELYTDRWMLEHYGYNFRYSTQEGGPLSLMDAYNLINGIHCTENVSLLKTTLRQRWGFPFYVVSDWAAVYTSKSAVLAGTDICMGAANYANDLPNLVSSGSLAQADLNASVANILRTKIMSGMMDYYPKADPSFMNSTAHEQIALQCAQKSIILLKNTNKILPINATTVKTIAIIGPDAARGNLNCYGSSEVAVPYLISLKQGLMNRIGSSKISYVKGCDLNSTDTSGFAAAKTLAKTADYVIFAGGLDSTLEGEAYNIGNDRTGNTIDLPGKQQDLINALSLVNPNLIVVIQSGGVCGINRCVNSIKGLLYSFYPGIEGGNAIADVIVGNVNPAGRMPVTMPKSDSQLPVWDDDFTNDFGCGYRWFDQNNLVPEFPFGFGLSYTTFAYSNFQLSTHNAPAGTPVTASVDVQNTGTVDGEEVVELYQHNTSSTLWMPKKELKGFSRVAIKAGQKQTVSFTLSAEDFYFWDENLSKYAIEPGMFSLAVGGSSDNLPLIDSVNLTSTAAKPDLKITQIMTMPRYPIKGQLVRCYALVKNQGTASVAKGTTVNIAFTVDNAAAASVAYAVPDSIPAGGARLIESTTTWPALNVGTFLLAATVDNTNNIDEWIESNNTFSRKIDVISQDASPTNNLALNKPVVASSTENGSYPATNAVDGLASTRWSSTLYVDPQYIVVDLKAVYALNKVVLNWETACAKAFTISISKDSITWTTVTSVTAGVAGITNYTISGSGRYVKINGTVRGTTYGYSLYELEVYGAASGTPIAKAGGDKTIVNSIAGTTLDGTASSDPNGDALTYTWTQLSGPTTATLAGSNTATLTATNLDNGQYYFKLSVSDGTSSSSDIAMVTVNGSLATTQTVALKKGMNLVSFYVSPSDKSIETVFSGILSKLTEVKNANAFWYTGQNILLNSLTSINDGDAYMITVSADATLNVTGTPVNLKSTILKTGWNLIGYPKNTQSDISTTTAGISTLFSIIKTFDGYYQTTGTTNSINTFDPGKGYFIKANSTTTLTW